MSLTIISGAHFSGSVSVPLWASSERAASLLRRAAEFLQALATLLPGGGIEDVDGGKFVHFETGNPFTHAVSQAGQFFFAANSRTVTV